MKSNIRFLLFIFCTAVLLLESCTENTDIFIPKEYPELKIQGQNQLPFYSNNTSMNFTIINSGTGSINWSAFSSEAWIKCYPVSGTLTSSPQQITVAVDRTGLLTGQYSGNLGITSNGGNLSVGVTMEVTGEKWLEYDNNTFIDGASLTGIGWLWTRFTRPEGWTSTKVTKVKLYLYDGATYSFDLDGFDNFTYESSVYFPSGSFISLKTDVTQGLGWSTHSVNKTFTSSQFFIAVYVKGGYQTYVGYDTTDSDVFVCGYKAGTNNSCYNKVVYGIGICVEQGGADIAEPNEPKDQTYSPSKKETKEIWIEPDYKNGIKPPLAIMQEKKR